MLEIFVATALAIGGADVRFIPSHDRIVSGATAHVNRLSEQEYMGLAYCIGLMEGSGVDPAPLEEVMRVARRGHLGYYARRSERWNTEQARNQMRRASGEQLADLVDQRDRVCPAYLTRLPNV